MKCTQALVLCITVAPMLAIADNLRFLATDAKSGSPLANTVILLPIAVDPMVKEAAVEQENRQFSPRVLVVPTNTSVAFPNRDNTQHHVYSFSTAKTFEIELYGGIPEAPIAFDTPGIVELGCNIHDRMQGFIVVTDQRYGITDDHGEVSVKWPQDRPVPQRVRIWHPRLADNTTPIQLTLDSIDRSPLRLSLNVRPEPETDSSLERLQQRYREL